MKRARSTPRDGGVPVGPVGLQIDAPGLVAALSDFAASSLWEALRQFGRPATVEELATVLSRPHPQVQRSIDAFLPLGLVRRIAATSRSRRIRYEVTTQKIIIGWDPADPRHQERYRALAQAFEAKSAEQLARGLPHGEQPRPAGHSERRLFWANLDAEDRKELLAILGLLDLLMARVNARHAATPANEDDAPALAALCNYHVAFALVPIVQEFPPLALIQVDGNQNTPYGQRHRANLVFGELTPRERQVFDLLLSGPPLDAIGQRLGISRATVATLARNCYRKFGVRGRQELVASVLGLGGAAPPPRDRD